MMKIVRVRGSVTATVQVPGLAARKLLIVDVQDTYGTTLETARVAVDCVGAGPGLLCLMVEGSAARLATNGEAIDAALVAIIDDMTVS